MDEDGVKRPLMPRGEESEPKRPHHQLANGITPLINGDTSLADAEMIACTAVPTSTHEPHSIREGGGIANDMVHNDNLVPVIVTPATTMPVDSVGSEGANKSDDAKVERLKNLKNECVVAHDCFNHYCLHRFDQIVSTLQTDPDLVVSRDVSYEGTYICWVIRNPDAYVNSGFIDRKKTGHTLLFTVTDVDEYHWPCFTELFPDFLHDKIKDLGTLVDRGELTRHEAHTKGLELIGTYRQKLSIGLDEQLKILGIKKYKQRLDATPSAHSTNMPKCDAVPPTPIRNTTGVDDGAAVSGGVDRVEAEEVVRGHVIGSKPTPCASDPSASGVPYPRSIDDLRRP